MPNYHYLPPRCDAEHEGDECEYVRNGITGSEDVDTGLISQVVLFMIARIAEIWRDAGGRKKRGKTRN